MDRSTAGTPDRVQADGVWQRLHPITPLLRGWKVIAAVIAASAQQSFEAITRLASSSSGAGHWIVATAVAGGLLALIGWCVISWRMTRYRVDAERVEYRSGVLFRQQKQAQLDRLQAVDVVRPLLGRMVGLCELRIEVAGGQGSDFRLCYLNDADADRLRRVLLAGSAGLAVHPDEVAQDAPEAPVFSLPTDRLVAASLLSGLTIGAVLWLGALGVSGIVMLRQEGAADSFTWSSVTGFIVPSLGVLATIWARFAKRFSFEVAHAPDGVRLRHGLIEHRSQTVLPGRIQALEISQPLLWRRRGWWNVEMNVAGYSDSLDDDETSATTLVAVATVEELLRVLPLVIPDLGHSDPEGVLRTGMTGTSGDDGSARLGWVCAPRSTRMLDLLGWKRHGVLATRTALVMRGGIIRRRMILVPHARMQSAEVSQGPFQRRLEVGTFSLHSTPGPVRPRVEHLAVQDAAELLAQQVHRSAAARASAGPQRWMEPTVSDSAVGPDLTKQYPPQ